MEAGTELDLQIDNILKSVMGPEAANFFSDTVPKFSTDEDTTINLLDIIRLYTGKCVLLEASVNPREYLCTVGWHHRGQWFKDFQVSAETAPHAVSLALLETQKCPKP